MKVIVEFGVRGGRNTSHVCPTAKAASNLAASLAFVFGMTASRERDFLVRRDTPRRSVVSSSHFVAVSLLDDVTRGPFYTGSMWNADRMERKPE